MNRSWKRQAGLSILLLAGFAPATGTAQAQDNKAASIVLSSQPNEAGFPMWLANKLGYYSERGLTVKIQYFPNGGAALMPATFRKTPKRRWVRFTGKFPER